MARLASEGHDVYVMILGEGVTSRYDRREDAGSQLLDDLHSCTHEAAKVLGVKDVFMFNLPDNRFDTVPLLEVIKLIEGVIERVQPAAIYAQHGGDLNIDHATVYRATLAATRPLPGSSIAQVHAFEVASSTEWSFGQFAPAFQPNVFVDISATLDLKIRAMECYQDEMRPFPHPRSAEALRAIAQRWGSVAGVSAAEAFAMVRDVR